MRHHVEPERPERNPPYAGNAPGQHLNIGGGANSRFAWLHKPGEQSPLPSAWRWDATTQAKEARVYQDNYSNKILAYTNGCHDHPLLANTGSNL